MEVTSYPGMSSLLNATMTHLIENNQPLEVSLMFLLLESSFHLSVNFKASAKLVSSAIDVALVRQSRSIGLWKRGTESLWTNWLFLQASNIAQTILVLLVLVRLHKLIELQPSEFIALRLKLVRRDRGLRQRSRRKRSPLWIWERLSLVIGRHISSITWLIFSASSLVAAKIPE